MIAQIGTTTKILSGCHIEDNIEIGENNIIGPNVVIGTPPQHRDYYANKRELGKVRIGNGNVIREFVSIHAPMQKSTTIGNNCFIMAYSHVSHDTIIENNVVLTNNVQIAGHSHVMEGVTIGLGTVIHQYTTIGAYTMIGMGSIVTKDILPFLVYKNFCCYKINVVGLERNGFTDTEITEITEFYKNNIDNTIKSRRVNSSVLDFYEERNTDRRIADVVLR